MPEAVSSGIGRTGPWLQNSWLRVETRLDDGSISPIALDGAFRPAERGLASVQLLDAPGLQFGRCDYDIRPHHDELGGGRLLSLTSRLPARGATLRRETVLYDAHPFCITRVGVTNESPETLRLAALHAFTTPADRRGKLQLKARTPDLRIYRHGWQSWSPTMSFGGAEMDVQSKPSVLSPEEPQREPGKFSSDDVGVLFDPTTARSLLCGAVTARDMLSQVFIDAPLRFMDARCLADASPVEPGATRWSERLLIDLCGGPNDQLERYGDALSRLMGARVPARQPSGWCSWYYFYQDVTEADVVRNLRFLEQHRRDLPIDTVQIDDGYQADMGDWLTVNEKFPHGMAWLASEIRRAGYTPGIWLAPFLLAESSKAFAAHPEFVVRGEDGEPALAMHNWQRNCWAIDGTNPDATQWLTDVFREICDRWGYEYVKIDFLFAAAIAGRRFDQSATRIHAYRRALDAVRAGVRDERFILGCGSLMAPSVGYFDGNRIGLDVAPFWRFLTTEERSRPAPRSRRPDDQLSAEGAIRNTLNRSWMHGRLWANDPDCILVRTDRTKLTLDETRTLASVIGLSGGMVLSSDDLERVPAERLEILSMMLPALPRSARPADLIERDMPERYEYVDGREFDPVRLIGLFNFDDVAKDIVLPLPGGRRHVFELWSGRHVREAEGALTFSLVEPHGCRVVALRPASGRPQLVGSTAHIGCGVVDITDQTWDAESKTLSLGVSPAGRRSREIFVHPGDLEFQAARLDGVQVEARMQGGVIGVSLVVDRTGNLDVYFR